VIDPGERHTLGSPRRKQTVNSDTVEAAFGAYARLRKLFRLDFLGPIFAAILGIPSRESGLVSAGVLPSTLVLTLLSFDEVLPNA
jgi:hypothetical protein